MKLSLSLFLSLSHNNHFDVVLLLALYAADYGAVWYDILSNNFQFLNNITRISTHFFTHTYFLKIQTTLLEQR